MKRALMYASVASMIDLFNMDNIKLLQKIGYQVDVACNFDYGSITSDERVIEFRKELSEIGVQTYNIPIPRNLAKIEKIKESYNLTLKIAEKNNYDLVHCHSPIGSVICRWAFRNIKTRMIYTAHGFHFYKGAPKINWITFYPIEKMMAKYTDSLITINREDFERAKKFPVRETVVRTNGIGVDTSKFNPIKSINRNELLSKEGITDANFLLVSVGQLSERKNHQMVINALANINNKNIKYIIIGEGELNSKLKAQIKQKNLEKQVFLLGYKQNINEYLSVADTFVFPSLQEGLPASLMEAMACSLPCIASNIRGNNDLIIDNKGGYLFNLNNNYTLVQSIKKLYSNVELRKEFGAFNSDYVIEFSSDIVKKQMNKIYKESE